MQLSSTHQDWLPSPSFIFILDSGGTSGDIRKDDYLRSFEHMDAADEYKPSPLDTRFITLRVSIFWLARCTLSRIKEGSYWKHRAEAPDGRVAGVYRSCYKKKALDGGTGRRHWADALDGCFTGAFWTLCWRISQLSRHLTFEFKDLQVKYLPSSPPPIGEVMGL